MLLSKLLTLKNLIYLTIFVTSIWQFGSGTYIYAKAHYAQFLLEKAWDNTRHEQDRVKPWSWADTYPVAKISFRNLNKDYIVLAGGSGRTMAFGPGHISATPLPGENGNSVIVGHRDTHFSVLKDLEMDSVIDIHKIDQVLSYKVANTFIVDHSQVEVMSNQNEELLTLITCYPFEAIQSGGPLRYVVQALPIDPST